MRYLALDIGDERIGLAISDATGLLARPLTVIARRPGPGSFRQIAALVAEHGVEAIVVGLPLLPSGQEGKQVASVRAYVKGLMEYVALPIYWQDERDTTREAEAIMAETGRSARRRRRLQDAVAAAVILQAFLNERRERPL
ncbi:MAG: Holliday junction resolvase RuvX [Chloroflexi bacterium]|nr:Holliday junction resolvase RuvX [Chloroflexota bacterium]